MVATQSLCRCACGQDYFAMVHGRYLKYCRTNPAGRISTRFSWGAIVISTIVNLVGVKFGRGQYTIRLSARAPLGFISTVSTNGLGPMGWSGVRERL